MMKSFYTTKFAAILCVCLSTTLLSCSDDKENDEGTRTQPTVVVPDNAIDVSAAGTANCYLVNPGDTIVLDARFRGNSKTETLGAEVIFAKLLWQDTESVVNSVFYVPEAQKIVVGTSGKAGNAVVGAFDKEGEILWSWHLWIVEYQPQATLYTTQANGAGTTWTFMDRNIGALNATPSSMDSHGMLYQWGRKDPFTSAKTFTIINEDYSYQEDGERQLYNIHNHPLPITRYIKQYHGTIEKSIRYPEVYFAMTYNYTGELDENGYEIVVNDYRTKDWVDVSNDDYWGGVSGKKTIYDPCPVGYKIPVCDAAGNTPYAWLVFANMVWDTTNLGATQDGQWFPAVGTRVYASGGLNHVNKDAHSGMWIGTAGKASSNLEEFPDLYGQYMYILNSKRMFKVSKDARSQGLSVRCVKE